MQELLMDVLRVLSTPDMDIRRKTLNIALDLTTAQNIEEVLSISRNISSPLFLDTLGHPPLLQACTVNVRLSIAQLS